MSWVVAHNTTFLLGYLLVQMVFFPSSSTAYEDAVPWSLEAINRNGLAVFILVCCLFVAWKLMGSG